MIKLIKEQSEYPKYLHWDELTDAQKNQAVFQRYTHNSDIYNDRARFAMRREYSKMLNQLPKKFDVEFEAMNFDFTPTLTRVIPDWHLINRSLNKVFDEPLSEDVNFLIRLCAESIAVSFTEDLTPRYNNKDSLKEAVENIYAVVDEWGYPVEDSEYIFEQLDITTAKLARTVKAYVAYVEDMLNRIKQIQHELWEKYSIREAIYDMLEHEQDRVYVIKLVDGEEVVSNSYVE